jgi:CRISPR-associated endonuclease/helicase Cas3
MMVTFVSQCEKKALARTRRVLDAFANRIGERTWQTIITEDGLIAVKKLLRKTVTKNTAVSCHWIRSRSRSELVWIVGNRSQFNSEGIVAVNRTSKKLNPNDWENNWHYLPLIKGLVGLSGLLHDWGKASQLFQDKLKQNLKQSDPLRHEWVSCLLLNALVQLSGDRSHDEAWLNLLLSGDIDEDKLLEIAQKNDKTPLHELPPIAQWVAWLILTHHRMPSVTNKEKVKSWSELERKTIASMLKSIKADWGYERLDEDNQKRLSECFVFPQGLLSQSTHWRKSVQKWAKRLLAESALVASAQTTGAWRVVLHHARLSLMLGDHYFSSRDKDEQWQSELTLHANTDKQHRMKQKLDEHLLGVTEYALKISHSLSRFREDMGTAQDITNLKKKSPTGFEWQDKAVDKITNFVKEQSTESTTQIGWFVVNMASTGCGKTIANAKIMRALSSDANSLRYVLALGLRTLTLQTGDEYRHNIGLTDDELAVLIGSSAVKELHEHNKAISTNEPAKEIGSESLEALLDEEIETGDAPTADFLEAVITSDKHRAFLYRPVLACTIDHIISATETTRGGKYILPALRLLSSDLVIDEVDDFSGQDLIAIGRLIHLAGMLGRKVMISSATIPPALAEGFFNVYQEGWRLYHQFHRLAESGQTETVACAWVDEFSTQVQRIELSDLATTRQAYQSAHQQFIDKRVKKLDEQIIKRKAYIAPVTELNESHYFEQVKANTVALHQQHHTIDRKTGKRVSFGVVRVANVPPCIALSRYLLEADFGDTTQAKIMTYHSRQVLLLRSQQEKHLDEVLKRKEVDGKEPIALSNPIIRQHLDDSPAQSVMFIVVATPVEEVGRDHDFDWAIIEPSSYRSIIQLAGRVRRHRKTGVEQPNIAIMQYNLKALRNNEKPVFCRPGFETLRLQLITHDLCQLVDEEALKNAVNAIPRIQQPSNLKPQHQLADLEHQAMINDLKAYDKKGAKFLQAWLSECWWMTGVPQQLNRFRESSPEIKLCYVWENGKLTFAEYANDEWVYGREGVYAITQQDENSDNAWLIRDYETVIREHIDSQNKDSEDDALVTKTSKRYGEISIRQNKDSCYSFEYSDQFGLLEKK